MSWIEHHRESEELASAAEVAQRDGDRGKARALYAAAAGCEERAIECLDPEKTRTLGISAVSAASLYYKAASYRKATQVAHRWLRNESLPAFARGQLTDVAQSAFDLIEGMNYLLLDSPRIQTIEDFLDPRIPAGELPSTFFRGRRGHLDLGEVLDESKRMLPNQTGDDRTEKNLRVA